MPCGADLERLRVQSGDAELKSIPGQTTWAPQGSHRQHIASLRMIRVFSYSSFPPRDPVVGGPIVPRFLRSSFAPGLPTTRAVPVPTSGWTRFSIKRLRLRCGGGARQERGALSTGWRVFGGRGAWGRAGAASNTRRRLSLLRQAAKTGAATPGDFSKAERASWGYPTLDRVLSPGPCSGRQLAGGYSKTIARFPGTIAFTSASRRFDGIL